MGGFVFIGSEYTFSNVKNKRNTLCNCKGFRGTISDIVQKQLLENKKRILNIFDLKDEILIEKLTNIHIGDEMEYEISTNINKYHKSPLILKYSYDILNNKQNDIHFHENKLESLQPFESFETIKVDSIHKKKVKNQMKNPWSRK